MKKNNCPNNKAIAIVRVSSAKQKDGISHSAQEQAIQDHCVKYDLKLEKIFKIVESASSSKNRKQYSEAIREAIKDRIGNVLFYMLDRETRNRAQRRLDRLLSPQLYDAKPRGRRVVEVQLVGGKTASALSGCAGTLQAV